MIYKDGGSLQKNQIEFSTLRGNMKVIVVLSLVATAFASLEPAGYRPPGSAPPSTRYLPSNADERLPPSARYLPASQTRYRAAAARFSAPSSAYLPAADFLPSAAPSRIIDGPLTSYGLPAPAAYSAPVAAPVDRYLPASGAFAGARGSGYRYDADGESVPAKYDFQYEVKDNYGNDFGQRESRDGDDTRGMYSVLLPDGRKQTVEYTADEDGFKPKISYEEPRHGYAGAAAYSQGYPGGPY